MNGVGKLWEDPSAPGAFIGRGGDIVSLALRSNFPTAFVSATYQSEDQQNLALQVQENRLAFQIAWGRGTLTFAIMSSKPGQPVDLVEITDRGEHRLAVLGDWPAFTFSILGQ